MRGLTLASRPPIELFQWTLAHWDEVSSQLIERLCEFAAGRRDLVSEVEALYIVHLCGEKRDRRAYPILCAMIAGDARIADWLDDAVTETLPGILISVFDGEVGFLQDAIESQAGDAFARASALTALGYLVREKGILSQPDMKAYLWRLWRQMQPRGESILWLVWSSTVASLGYDDMSFAVLWLNREGFVPERCFRAEEFNRRMALAASDHDFVRPLDDAVAALKFLLGRDATGGSEQTHSPARAMPRIAGSALCRLLRPIGFPEAPTARLQLIKGGKD